MIQSSSAQCKVVWLAMPNNKLKQINTHEQTDVLVTYSTTMKQKSWKTGINAIYHNLFQCLFCYYSSKPSIILICQGAAM